MRNFKTSKSEYIGVRAFTTNGVTRYTAKQCGQKSHHLTEREAAKVVDIYRIKAGKHPVNILQQKF